MNVVTSRYVPKWKQITDPNTKKTTWLIRMRLTQRGFQDWWAHLYEHYAGTSTRSSQRLVASEVAAHAHEGWIMVSVDIDKAFLQGMSYEEIHRTTGEPRREVFCVLPPGSAAILRRVRGFEYYDERLHCLRCLVPGTGTADAPRAFPLKLGKVTRSTKCGYVPLTYDPQTEKPTTSTVISKASSRSTSTTSTWVRRERR